MFSTLLDYFTGLKMQDASDRKGKRFWFWLSVIVNLGFLGVFKYYNFFADSFAEMMSQFGMNIDPWTIQVILPVGISFYTFHGLSYVIDIYYDRIPAEVNFVEYAVFVSFFPLLVAGPLKGLLTCYHKSKRKDPSIITKRLTAFAKFSGTFQKDGHRGFVCRTRQRHI